MSASEIVFLSFACVGLGILVWAIVAAGTRQPAPTPPPPMWSSTTTEYSMLAAVADRLRLDQATNRALLTELVARMETPPASNTITGRVLGALCDDALDDLPPSVLDYSASERTP